jgi:modulator of FtsH protease
MGRRRRGDGAPRRALARDGGGGGGCRSLAHVGIPTAGLVLSIDGWGNFFVAQCGASAALLGLLFVSVSLNLPKILAIAHLPQRAMLAMLLLLTILIVASLMLIPGQPVTANAIEILVVGLLISGAACSTKFRDLSRRNPDWRHYFIGDVLFVAAATLPYLIAGGLLLAGASSGLYWLAAAFILSTAKAVLDAWVLLVEINR